MTPDVRSAQLPNGLRLPYVEQGEESGVPVVLLHAYADSWRSFERLLPHLPPSIHAFAVTQRGHGDADRPASGYRVEEFTADLAAFMDAVALEAAVLVASSSASFTVQRFAVDHPERTLGILRAARLGAFATNWVCLTSSMPCRSSATPSIRRSSGSSSRAPRPGGYRRRSSRR